MQNIEGRVHKTRAELAAQVNRSEVSLSKWWADRENNDHPPAVRVGRVLHWDEQAWTRWHADRDRTTWRTHNPPGGGNAPSEVTFSDLADDALIGPAEAAAELGMDVSTVNRHARNPPAGWPEPVVHITTHMHTEQPRWRAGDLRDYIRNRDGSARGRPSGQAPTPRKNHAYEGDPRLDIAAAALAAHPDTAATATAARLAQDHGGAARTWERICAAALRLADRADATHRTP